MTLEMQEVMTGKRFEERDFSNMDFRGRSLAHSVFVKCNFDGAIFPEAPDGDAMYCEFRLCSFKRTKCYKTNFAFSVFPGCAFEPSDMYGATVTLTCKLWENTAVGQLWLYMWLMLAASMRPIWRPINEDLREQLIAFIGAERYIRLRDMMGRRDY